MIHESGLPALSYPIAQKSKPPTSPSLDLRCRTDFMSNETYILLSFYPSILLSFYPSILISFSGVAAYPRLFFTSAPQGASADS